MNSKLSSWGIHTAQTIIQKLDQNKTTLKDMKKFSERCSDLSGYRDNLLLARTKASFIKILTNAIKESL